MNLTEFGLLVKTLRNSSFDEYGNRWTRENLSRAVHLSADQLGRLERGERKYLDNQTLQLLADCFNLTNLERKEFYLAAVGLSDNELYARLEPDIQLNKLISTLESLNIPGFIIDVYADIIAANKAVINLMCLTPDIINYARTIPAGFNLINYIYSSSFGCKEIFGPLWREMATIEVLLFRRSSLRYRHTEYFSYLLKALLKEKEFDIDWYSSHRNTDHYDLTYERFVYDHPRYGPLNYTATETVVNSKKGDLYLVLYNPADSETETVFSGLRGTGDNTVQKLAGWPEKSMI